MEASTWADHARRPVPCLPMPSPLWQGMVPLERNVDPADDRLPAVLAWVSALLGNAAGTPVPCPRCGRTGGVPDTLDHLFGDHAATYAEVADILERADPDLFALAVHYLAGKARRP